MQSKLDTISKDFNPTVFHPYYFIRKGLYKKIAQYANFLSGDLLDFGCGSKPYMPLFKHCTSYTGVDFENVGHSHKNEHIDVFYDGKKLPFADNKFDSIFSSEVFEHLFNLPEILLELIRVLKPGGRLLITCPFVWPEHETPHDYARYSMFALREELEKKNFKIVLTDKSGDFVTSIYQLSTAYIHDIILPKFSFGNRIPALYRLAKFIVIPTVNIIGNISSKLLPTNKAFYLSNIVIAEKPR
jgi:SAM-dependent methyltransferase